jgi:hypothetical protein
MMSIGPSRGRGIGLLLAVSVAALVGCGEGYEVAERRAAVSAPAAAENTCRFEQSRQLLPVSRASWLTSLDYVTPKHWPAGMYDDFRKHQEVKRARGSRAPDWPTRRADRFRFEAYRSPARAFVVKPGGHSLFFVSLLTMRNTMRSGGDSSGAFHTVAVLDVDRGMQEQVLLRNVEGGQRDAPLEFQVAAVGDDVVLVYATGLSIFHMRGRASDQGFVFSKPALIRQPQVPALDLCLATSPRGLHLVWTEPGETPAHRSLHYTNTTGPDASWSVPLVGTETAVPGTANLLIDGTEVFALWADGRFVAGGTESTSSGKVMAMASRDEGMTFSRPVMISDPTDADDTAARLLVAMSGHDLVVYSSPESGSDWPQRWRRATLDRSLRAVTPEGELTGDELLAAYSSRMISVLEKKGTDLFSGVSPSR